MSQEKPPPPGVSTTDGRGRHVPIQRDVGEAQEAVKRTPRGRKVKAGDDPLQDLERFRVLQDGSLTPAGTGVVRNDIREGRMPETRRARRHVTSFKSVDGNTYTFRTHDQKGQPLPQRIQQCLFLCIIEMSKGGDPLAVLDAFKLKINTETGDAYYPIPEAVLASLVRRVPAHDEIEEEEEGDTGFSLGG